MRSLKAGAAYFVCVFGVGSLLGSIRVPFLVPRFGVRAAELMEMPFMLAAILVSSRWIVNRFDLLDRSGTCLAAGLLALLLLGATELVLAFGIQGLSPLNYLASRDPVSGGAYAGMLLLCALMPYCWSRIDALKSLILDH
jgi:hypothetical protein